MTCVDFRVGSHSGYTFPRTEFHYHFPARGRKHIDNNHMVTLLKNDVSSPLPRKGMKTEIKNEETREKNEPRKRLATLEHVSRISSFFVLHVLLFLHPPSHQMVLAVMTRHCESVPV